jgi:RHS repeat-associated protein
VVSLNLDDFTVNAGAPAWPSSGVYTSGVYDAGRSVDWGAIAWTADTPGTSTVAFQVAVSESPSGPWSYVGPDGTSGTSFTTSETALPALTGRYARFQVTLSGDGTMTPTVSRVRLAYGGITGSVLNSYTYDANGNIVQKLSEYLFAVSGTMTNGSNVVSGVSSEDTARLTVGETVAHAALPGGTTVTAIGSGAFTLSNNATATATGSIVVSGTGSEVRNLFVVGDLASSSTTVGNVSASDLAKLTVGDSVVHPLLPDGTTVASVSTGSFTVSQAATGTQAGAVVTGVTTAWPSTDVINNLNQILRNDITPPGGSTTTWRYTYDLSGNTTSKTDGTNLTVYAWDEENRLTLVTLPDSTTIAYTYDAAGRLLTRKKSTDADPTVFEWDGMDIVGETAPDGTATRLFVIQGLLRAFERSGTRHEVQADGIGHVRIITNSAGVVVYRANYDAWGGILSEVGTIVGEWFYCYVGAYGVRWDAAVSLYYMRSRWYNASDARFVSRDPVRSPRSPYLYASNRPATFVDPSGLREGVKVADPNDPYIRREMALTSIPPSSWPRDSRGNIILPSEWPVDLYGHRSLPDTTTPNPWLIPGPNLTSPPDSRVDVRNPVDEPASLWSAIPCVLALTLPATLWDDILVPVTLGAGARKLEQKAAANEFIWLSGWIRPASHAVYEYAAAAVENVVIPATLIVATYKAGPEAANFIISTCLSKCEGSKYPWE